MGKVSYFAVPITNEEYTQLKSLYTKENTATVYKNILKTDIIMFGDPENGKETTLKNYIDETLIRNRWHHKNNFFTQNRLFYGEQGFAIQSDISAIRFLKEIAKFHGTSMVLIYKDDTPLKKIKYEFIRTTKLIREGYKNANTTLGYSRVRQ